jgi:hypothetical protein
MNEYVCDDCGKEFDDGRVYNGHLNVPAELAEYNDMVPTEYDSLVYVLRVENPDTGQRFYYVGTSTAFDRRLQAHLEDKQGVMSMPGADGERDTRSDYNVLSIEQVEVVDDASVWDSNRTQHD